ncbi:MAG: polyketide synthase [Deltaproteobacteria bacterium]|jgi:3-oxoacyl-(acyl-carrier-protein) synthase|nr:polyketide synthase [Deltaproteobacteria bacterium]
MEKTTRENAQTPRERELIEALSKARSIIARLTEEAQRPKEKIAVIGASGLFPAGGTDARGWESFFDSLMDGVQSVLDIPEGRARHWQRLNHGSTIPLKRAALLTRDMHSADISRFGLTPAEGRLIDPHTHLSLEVVLDAFDNAAVDFSKLAGSDTGVFFGRGGLDFILERVYPAGPEVDDDPFTLTGNLESSLSGRVSRHFDLRGPSVFVDTACSTSLVAVILAARSLAVGDCDLAVAGAANLLIGPRPSVWLSAMGALSPDGRTKAFADQADGFGRGEGAAAVVLKRLSEAQRDGDRILAVIEGAAISANGGLSAFTVTSASAQEAVMRKAINEAAIDPSQVAYVETHGTGTAVGDPIEAEALISVYGTVPRPSELLIGSVKSNIGHLEAAAGGASLLKVIGALRRGQIPPSLLAETKSRLIDWSAGISLVQSPRPWPNGYGRRVAGISSFGITGALAHLILSQAPAQAPAKVPGLAQSKKGPTYPIRVVSLGGETPPGRPATGSSHTASSLTNSDYADPSRTDSNYADPSLEEGQAHNLYLSAFSPQALKATAAGYVDRLKEAPDFALMARTSALRPDGPYRLALTADDSLEALEALRAFLAGSPAPFLTAGQPKDWTGPIFSFGCPEFPSHNGPEITNLLVFFRSLGVAFPFYGETFARLLALWPELASGPPKGPRDIAALHLIHQLSLSALLGTFGLEPSAIMGFGLGEAAALAAAGLFGSETALKLLHIRTASPSRHDPSRGDPSRDPHSLAATKDLSPFRDYLSKLSWGRLKKPYLPPGHNLYLDGSVVSWPDYFLDWAQKPLTASLTPWPNVRAQPVRKVLEMGPHGQWVHIAETEAAENGNSPMRDVFPTQAPDQAFKTFLFSLARLWTLGSGPKANPVGTVCPEALPRIHFDRRELDFPWPSREPELSRELSLSLEPGPSPGPGPGGGSFPARPNDRLITPRPEAAKTAESPQSSGHVDQAEAAVALGALQYRSFLEVCRAQMASLVRDRGKKE